MRVGYRHLSSAHDWHIYATRIIHPLLSPRSSALWYDRVDLVCGESIPTLEQIS
jgi:hypothetical protein